MINCNYATPRCPDCTQPMRRAWGFPNHRNAMKWTCPQQCEGVTVYTDVITGRVMESLEALSGQGPNKVYVK